MAISFIFCGGFFPAGQCSGLRGLAAELKQTQGRGRVGTSGSQEGRHVVCSLSPRDTIAARLLPRRAASSPRAPIPRQNPERRRGGKAVFAIFFPSLYALLCSNRARIFYKLGIDGFASPRLASSWCEAEMNALGRSNAVSIQECRYFSCSNCM